ncbi:8270_t:CDS:2, partial [Racocetra fulgida]
FYNDKNEINVITTVNNVNNITNVTNNYNEKKFNDDNKSEYESAELDVLKLIIDMEFGTWEIAKAYLEDYAKQEGFCFPDVVEEIQAIFDKQSKRALLNKFKNEIATKGLPNIMEEYFLELNKQLKEYFTPQIYQSNVTKSEIDQQILSSISMYQIVRNILNPIPPKPLLFNHLSDIRKLTHVEQKRSSKQKYGFGISYAKKALDYTIRADKVDEFINYLERFIKDTKDELDKHQDVTNIENLIVINPIHM